MADVDLLKPIPDGTFLKKYRNGLFAVPKDSSRDRMVLDGRPANMVDRGQQRWSQSMASGAALAGIYIEDDKDLVCSGEDLKDCFYQFKVGDQRTARNVLAGSLSLEEAKQVFGKQFEWPSAEVHVGLSSLAMGDLAAVEFAQCSHLGIMLQYGVATAREIITMHGAIPRGLLQVGIIVDDLVVLEQVLKTGFSPDGDFQGGWQSKDRMGRATRAYDDVQLKHNPKKSFLGERTANFWGVDIDGAKGLLRASQKRLWPTMVITLRVCSLGLCTLSLLESLAGMWVSLLGVRRRLYSLLDVIFEPLTLNCRSNTVIRLSDALISEMTSVTVLATLAVVNLRAKFAGFVVATDASNDVIAGVRAQIDEKVAQEMARHVIRRGVWSRLLPPGQALLRVHGLLDPEDEVPADGYRTHPLWETLARALHYKESWRRRIGRPQHVNVSELQAFVTEEKRIANSTPSCRFLAGADSQVALGTVAKGRAASEKLNEVMRTSMPYAIGGDVYSLPMYYNTASNRADAPTRGSLPPPPDLPLPAWYDELREGRFDAFDAWLKRVAAPSPDTDLPFADICGAQELDLRPSALIRTQSWRRGKQQSGPSQLPEMRSEPACLKRELSKDELPAASSMCEKSSRDGAEMKDCQLSKEAVDVLESFPKDQFFFREGVLFFREPGALDLYSGKYGVAKQMIAHGAPWVLTFEWNHSATEDLLQPEVKKKILMMFKIGCFKTFGAAPICSSFSVAVTPPVRSCRFPRGIPGLRHSMRQKVSEGNSHNDFVHDLVIEAESDGVFYFVENPDTSWWWRQRKWKRWRHSGSESLFRFCFCRFGTAWRKATRAATNTRLKGVRMMCTCRKPHLQLRGMHPVRKIPWTLVAQPYPRGLCRLLATALCEAAGWCKVERLNVADCAKLGSLRAGEAQNPGPRQRKPNIRTNSLADVQLLTHQTLALESRLLKVFIEWCGRYFTADDFDTICSCVPQFLADVVKVYGEELFRSGGALSNFRHLVLAVQRWKPTSRPFMSGPWELVEKWELVTPVTHRTPVPESLVQAMCVLGWQFEWYSWVGATVIAFYGAGRLGEILRCSREDLVLPGDVFEPRGAPVFLRLRTFKSRMRQAAKVQHMKISDPVAASLIAVIFRSLPLEAPLFDCSPYQYRKRWDFLLQLLNIDKGCNLTPGGLRGGAAVYHYKRGRPIADLLWLLRLRSQVTLESYLQEVAALNSFAKLSSSTRSCIQATASAFACLLSGERRFAG